jgi:hypothetical protein
LNQRILGKDSALGTHIGIVSELHHYGRDRNQSLGLMLPDAESSCILVHFNGGIQRRRRLYSAEKESYQE